MTTRRCSDSVVHEYNATSPGSSSADSTKAPNLRKNFLIMIRNPPCPLTNLVVWRANLVYAPSVQAGVSTVDNDDDASEFCTCRARRCLRLPTFQPLRLSCRPRVRQSPRRRPPIRRPSTYPDASARKSDDDDVPRRSSASLQPFAPKPLAVL